LNTTIVPMPQITIRMTHKSGAAREDRVDDMCRAHVLTLQ
jgi:hypothetical protein